MQQFQRAIDSLTAALSPASDRQYRAVARCFLIYLGEQHPAIASLTQLRRDPHILGWFIDLRSQNLAPAVYIARLLLMRCILQELAWNAQLPDLAHLIRPEDIDAAVTAVIAAGGTVSSRGEFGPGLPYAFVRDPDGHEIELWFERSTFDADRGAPGGIP